MSIKKKGTQKSATNTGDEFRDNANNRCELFSEVRGLYYKDEERNRNPGYKTKLQQIGDVLDEGSKDSAALSRLIHAPLKKQYDQEKALNLPSKTTKPSARSVSCGAVTTTSTSSKNLLTSSKQTRITTRIGRSATTRTARYSQTLTRHSRKLANSFKRSKWDQTTTTRSPRRSLPPLSCSVSHEELAKSHCRRLVLKKSQASLFNSRFKAF
jgi:hypothetical protein